MATRKAIREAFKSEIDAAVPSSGSSGHVPSDDITIERPESDEDIPSIVFTDASREVPLNQASGAPTRISRDQSGNAEEELYGKLVELRFDTLFWFTDEVEKEDCYEAVRVHFERYEEPAWDAADIHADVKWVRVRDAQPDDDADAEPARHGDRLGISLYFLREIGNTDTDIQQVDSEVDADDDGSTDATFTTTTGT